MAAPTKARLPPGLCSSVANRLILSRRTGSDLPIYVSVKPHVHVKERGWPPFLDIKTALD